MGKIQFKNINKVYPNGFHAIHDFNLDVDDGEFIVLVGPSGCGKSTLLRMLGGLEEISSGELSLDGKVINQAPPVERDIAIVFQDYALYGNMSVYDNVGISMKVRHEKDTAIYDSVMEAAEAADIMQYLNRFPSQLSGGQKQRVALARAIIRKPRAFLMDEPLSNLDAKLRNSTRTEIMKLHRQLGITTVYVTHDQTEAVTMADRIVVLKDGYAQQIGTPMEIYEVPSNIFVAGFIGVPSMNFIKGAIQGECFTFGGGKIELQANVLEALKGYMERELVLGLRPEAFTIVSPGEVGAVIATVDQTEFLGAHYIVHALIGGLHVEFTVPCIDKQGGDEIYLKPNMGCAHFFDAETGEAILHMGVGDGNAK